ncbi:MAG: AAA family ATPase [bacterium]|nr:AAA family ATPase [bacterium]
MVLSQIEIKNFRGVKKSLIKFHKHQVILGKNNSGKSTVIDAIGMLLGRDRLSRSLTDYDFFGGNPKPEDRLIIKGVITGFIDDDPSKSPEWFNNNSGGVPVWYSHETGILTHGNKPEGAVLGVEIAFCARFDADELEFEAIRYFFTGDTDPFEDTSLNRLRGHVHLKELGFYLLPSKRTWDRTMTFNSELFRRVLKFQEAIPGETVLKLRDELRANPNKIEDNAPLKDIIERLNNELSGFIVESDSKITFSPTSGDVIGVLESLTPFLEGQGNTVIPIGKHGSGLVSLQTLLLLLEFGRFRNETGKNFFLCAEEPELHLQPGLHRRLVGRIRGLGNQTITTTHSPEIASYYKPEEIMVLTNNDGELKATPLLEKELDTQVANAITRLYTIHRKEVCEALMNQKVIIPEGLTEYRWMSLLTNISITAEGWEAYHSDSNHTKVFGIIPTQDSHVKKTYQTFQPMISEVIPLVDGDGAGDSYIDDLKGVEVPPKVILRLDDGKVLEDVIEWIVNPTKEGRTTVLESIEAFEGRTFRQVLDQFKTHYGYHEALAQFMLINNDCVMRARRLINSIHNLSTEDENFNMLWEKNEGKSNDHTTVYNFNFPEINE